MQFRLKEEFISCLKKQVTEMAKEEHIVMNSPRLIKETIIDEPNVIKKRLVIEWEVINDKESEGEE